MSCKLNDGPLQGLFSKTREHDNLPVKFFSTSTGKSANFSFALENSCISEYITEAKEQLVRRSLVISILLYSLTRLVWGTL